MNKPVFCALEHPVPKSIAQAQTWAQNPNNEVQKHDEVMQNRLEAGIAGGNAEGKTAEGGGLVYSETSTTGFVIAPAIRRRKSLKRAVITSSRLIEEQLKKTPRRWVSHLVTFTYRSGVEWNPRQISTCFDRIEKHFQRKHGFKPPVVWVAEIQEKRRRIMGEHCVHYHAIIWLPKGYTMPKADKQGWWPYGSTNTERARNPVGYIAKYASKGTEFPFPKGLRTHGNRGMTIQNRVIKSFWMLPRYVREWWPEPEYRAIRAPGGGWLSRLTGDWMPSKFEVVRFSPLIVRERKTVLL